MSRMNHRQLTNLIGLCALMRLEHGPYLPHNVTGAPARSRPAGYPGRCPNCGTAIDVGDEIVLGRRLYRDGRAPSQEFVHVWCPSHDALMRTFFQVDGDVVFRQLPSPPSGRCSVCHGALTEPSFQVVTPDGLLTNSHEACVRTTGAARLPDPTTQNWP